MMQSKYIHALLAGISLLVLAGCEIEQPIVTAPVSTVADSAATIMVDLETNSESTEQDPESQSPVATADLSTDVTFAEDTDTRPTNSTTNTSADTPRDGDGATTLSKTDLVTDASSANSKAPSAIKPASDTDLLVTDSQETDMQDHIANNVAAAQTLSALADKDSDISDNPVASLQNVDEDRMEIASLTPKPDAPIQPIPKLSPKPEPARTIPKKPATPPPTLQPASLIGLTNKSLLAEIGEADFVRLEGQMQIWQYKTAACIIDFFLYPADDITTNPAYFITDWYSRPNLFGGVLDAKLCYEELARRQVF